MSRRDTIIIAVLVNVGLLVVLFVTSLKSGSSEQELAVVDAPEAAIVAELQIPSLPKEAIDQSLAQETTAVDAAPAISFADDLNGLATVPPVMQAAPIEQAVVNSVAQTAQDNVVEVKVKKGDSLDKIARANRSSVNDIMKANNLSTVNLKIGQTLKVPVGAGRKSGAAPSGEAKYYVVKNGDNPWTIAVKNHMKVDELLKLNNLNDEKARRLKPGDKLRIK